MGGIRFTWYLPPERPGWLESPWARRGDGWEAGRSLQGGRLSGGSQTQDGDGGGGEGLVRKQGERAMFDHGGRQICDMRQGLGMEVAQHFVGAPATHQPDNIGIDPGAKQRHGAASAEAVSGDAGGIDVEGGRGSGGRDAQSLCNGVTADGNEAVDSVNEVQGRSTSEVDDMRVCNKY